jgi:Neprosin
MILFTPRVRRGWSGTVGLLPFLILGSSNAVAAPSATAQGLPPGEAQRVQQFLDARYTAKDVRHSFHTKFGETIDCVDFFAQPGVKAMAAAGRPITNLPTPAVKPTMSPDLKDVLFTGTLDDQGAPRACPADSVPIVRLTPERIRAAGGLSAFLGAHKKKGTGQKGGAPAAPPGADRPNYAHTIQGYNGGASLIAGFATLNIQTPSVLQPDDHSLIQTWTTSWSDGNLETVECGSTVDPEVNGDRNPHFFIYATNNNYGDGCYNNNGDTGDCLGWIGAPGAYLAPGMTLTSSTFNGQQEELVVTVQLGDVGYGAEGWNIYGAGVYPSSDFGSAMAEAATGFQVGGEVYDVTSSWYVPMGSGAEAKADYGQAAYWVAPAPGAMGVFLESGSWDYTSFEDPWSTIPSAYSVNWWGGRVYFGPTEDAFTDFDYGMQWATYDWSVGNYKAECDAGGGVPLKGVASDTAGNYTAAILCGNYRQIGDSGRCYPRSFANGDNRGSTDRGWDWDPGYVKGECGYQEAAGGIAQSSSHMLNTILCCPDDNPDHLGCEVQTFDSSDSPASGAGPDWAVGYYKGVCPVGEVVVGVSRKNSGAAHAVLCCYGE